MSPEKEKDLTQYYQECKDDVTIEQYLKDYEFRDIKILSSFKCDKIYNIELLFATNEITDARFIILVIKESILDKKGKKIIHFKINHLKETVDNYFYARTAFEEIFNDIVKKVAQNNFISTFFFDRKKIREKKETVLKNNIFLKDYIDTFHFEE